MRSLAVARGVLSVALLALLGLAAACDPSDGRPEPTADPEDATPRPSDDPAPLVEPSPAPTPDPPPEDRPDHPADTPPPRHVWVAVEDADRTVLVDLDAGAIVADVATPGGPHNLTVAPDGTTATALYAASELAIIADGQVQLVTLGDRPHDVKATDDWFVVANEAGRRVELVSLAGEPGPTIDLPGEPHDLAIDHAGEQAWVTLNRRDDLAVIDLASATIDRRVATGHAPHDLLFAPDGRLWVTDWTGLLLVLDGDEVVHRRELGVEAHHLAFTPDGREAWITDHGTNELFVLDTDSIDVIDVIGLPGAPHHVAITPDGARAAVVDHTNGELLVFDVATREPVGTVAVGPGPHGVWAVPPLG